MRIEGAVVLVTGCSSGFGLLTAARLAQKGAVVYAGLRSLHKQSALCDELKRRNARARIVRLDVTDRDSVRDVINRIGDEHGRIDVLVNNAGIGIGGFFEDLTEKEFRLVMEVNFFGILHVTREVIPFMRRRREGRIINISSVAGLWAQPAFSAYNASKWALEGFSESLAHELRLFNIRVCCIEPGTYKTKIFFDNARYASRFDDPTSPYYPLSQWLKQKVLRYVSTSRKDPEDIARTVERLIRHPRPPLRTIPDAQSRFLYGLRRLLPLPIFMAVIRTTLFAGRPALEPEQRLTSERRVS